LSKENSGALTEVQSLVSTNVAIGFDSRAPYYLHWVKNVPELEREVTEVYCGHAAALLRFAAGLSSRSEVCNDAVQEAFLRYFIERRSGRAIENSQAWLYQVVRNYLLDRLKSASAQSEVAIEDADHIPGRQRSPEELVRQSERANQFASVLTGREMECWQLRCEGLTYQEIARAMSISLGTVGATLTHVHAKMRKMRDRKPSGTGKSGRRPVADRNSRQPAAAR
jgi:RNA polymerase sigma-70 factor, ECF subfamily